MALKFQIEGDSSGLRDEARKAVVTINEVGKVAERLGDKIDDAFLDSAKSAEELADAMSKQKAVCKELKAAYDTIKKAADEIADTEGYANDIAKEASDVRTSLNEAYVKQMGYLTEMTKQYESMAKEEEKQSGSLVNLMGGQEKYNAVLSAMPPTLRTCITEMQGLIAASEAFIATPIGAVLAALAIICAEVSIAFKTVSYWMNNTVEGEHELAKVTGVINGVMGWCEKVVAQAGERLWGLVERVGMATEKFPKLTKVAKVMATAFGGSVVFAIDTVLAALENLMDYFEVLGYAAEGKWKEALQALPAAIAKTSGYSRKVLDDVVSSYKTSKEIFDNIEASVQLEKDKVKILETENDLKVKSAKLDKEIAEAYNKVYSAQGAERVRLAKEVENLIDQKSAEETALAQMKLKVAQDALKVTPTSIADQGAVAQAEADLIRIQAQAQASKRGLERMIASTNRSAGANALKDASAALKEDAMLAYLSVKDEEAMKREARKRALAIKEAEIQGLQEGHERTLKTINLNEEKEALAIEQQKDALLMSKVNKAKQEWSAKGGKGEFNPKSITLTPEEEADFAKMLSAISDKYSKLRADLAKADADAMRDYLAKYGSMEERRLAIVQEYEDKIKTAKNEGEKATLKKEMEKSLSDLNFKQLEMDINWEALFNDLDKISKSHLELLRDQLQKYLQEGIKNGSVDAKNAKVLAERIAKLTEEAQSRSFSLFGGGKTSAGYDALRSNIQSQIAGLMAERNSTDAMKSPERFKELNTQILKLMKTLEDVDKEEKSLRVRARELAEGLSPVIDQMKAVTNLIGNLGLGDTAVGQASSGILSGTSQAQSALSNFASHNYIQAAADAVGALKDYGGAVQKLTGWGGGNADEVNKTTERLTKANEVLTSRIEDLTYAMGNSAGAKAIYAYEQALEAQNDINGNALEILRAQMGYSSAHHSNAYYANDSIIASYNGQAQKAFKAAGVASASITGLDSILGLTPEQIKAIKDFAPDLWKYVTEVGKYDKSEYWDNVVEQAGKAEALTKQIQDNLTQTSFDAMRESYLDALTDMEASSADFAQSIEDMMYKAVVNSLVLNDDFDAWLKEWQSDYANAVKNSNTSQLKQLQDEAVAKRAELVSERDAIASSLGYATGGSASSTINAAMSISEDTAQDIVGRMTAIQLICESERVTLNGMAQSVAQLPTLVDLTTTGNTMLLDMRNLMITGNSYLEDIAKYNKAMYNDWSTKIDRIQSKLETL